MTLLQRAARIGASFPAREAPSPARARCAALVLALLVGIGTMLAAPGAAQAAHPSQIDPSATVALVLTKLEQPQTMGVSGDGLPADVAGARVPGVTYTLTQVALDRPLTTVDGWERATALTTAEARDRLLPETETSRTTDAEGEARFATLPVGVYLVEETATPVGIVPAEPMLVVLPITDPEHPERWLYEVHAHPKAATLGISMRVEDEHAVTSADPVHWRARGELPRAEELTHYSMTVSLPPGLTLVGEPTASLRGGMQASLPELTEEDLSWSFSEGAIALDLTPSGLKTARAARTQDPGAVLELHVLTTASGNGSYTVIGGVRAATGDRVSDEVTDTARTAFGPLAVTVRERDHGDSMVPGAGVQLFLSPDDALAGRNPVAVQGKSTWYSDADGRLRIDGLKFSALVDGLDREGSDPMHRTYYVILTEIPSGYEGKPHPLEMTVSSTTDPQVALIELWKQGALSPPPGQEGGGGSQDDGSQAGGAPDDGGNGAADPDEAEDGEHGSGPGGPLATTGARVAGAALLTVVLLVLGVMLRLRRTAEAQAAPGRQVGT